MLKEIFHDSFETAEILQRWVITDLEYWALVFHASGKIKTSDIPFSLLSLLLEKYGIIYIMCTNHHYLTAVLSWQLLKIHWFHGRHRNAGLFHVVNRSKGQQCVAAPTFHDKYNNWPTSKILHFLTELALTDSLFEIIIPRRRTDLIADLSNYTQF